MAKASKKAAGDRPSPKCQALLLCEKAIIDRQRGRPSLIDIIDSIHAPFFPCEYGPLVVFLQVAEGIGHYTIDVEVRDLTTEDVIARLLGTEIQFLDRLERINVIVEIGSIPLNQAGAYDVVVLANGQDLDRQRLMVRLIEEEDDEGN